MIGILQAIAMLSVAIFATGVVLARHPVEQVIAFGTLGVALGVLFVVLQAPDVALSALVVGAVAYPAMVLLSIAKARKVEE